MYKRRSGCSSQKIDCLLLTPLIIILIPQERKQFVEQLLIRVIDAFLALDQDNSLSFEDKSDHCICWENNAWHLTSPKVPPLSLLIIDKNPERCLTLDDDFIIGTISQILDKPPWLILSFQDGWFGRSNRSASISGFLLGEKLRKRYWK